MKYNPLVSIIIPVYNGGNFMTEAIESALSQTYQNVEVIVVNDGSRDGGKTDAIAKSFIPRITYIYKPNGGVGSAINEGVRQMNGEYASWLSHDDLYYPNKIERQVAFLNGIIDKEGSFNDVIYSGTETINAKGEVILRKRSISKEIQNAEVVFSDLSNFKICGCATLIPKSLFEEIGYFDENLKTVQDTEFWCRILFRGHKYYFQNEYLVKNRRHAGQTSRTLASEWNKEIIDYQKTFLEKIIGTPELSSKLCVLAGVGKHAVVLNPLEIQDYYLELIKRAPISDRDRNKLNSLVHTWRMLRFLRSFAKSAYNKFIAK